MLQKGVYPYEFYPYDFFSHLNMEDITDADYAHVKKVSKDFETKNLGEYHDFTFKGIHYC